MKLKLTLMAVGATLALGYQAQASIGTVTNYDRLDISVVVKTNKSSVTVNDVTKYNIGTAKFNTKDLLNLISSDTWADTTFPAGAQIVVGWDSEWDGDILVVDKTGTNVLFDASDESASVDDNAYIEDGIEYDGAYTETDNSNSPGFESWDQTYATYFDLVDGDINLDLWADYPSEQQHFIQSWDKNGNYTAWSDSETISLNMGGDQEVNDSSDSSMTGSMKLSGHGKGANFYWY